MGEKLNLLADNFSNQPWVAFERSYWFAIIQSLSGYLIRFRWHRSNLLLGVDLELDALNIVAPNGVTEPVDEA